LDGSDDNLFLDSEGSFEDLEDSFIISPNPKRRMQRRLSPTIERELSDCEDSDGTCSTSSKNKEKYPQPVGVTNSSEHHHTSLNSSLTTDSEFEMFVQRQSVTKPVQRGLDGPPCKGSRHADTMTTTDLDKVSSPHKTERKRFKEHTFPQLCDHLREQVHSLPNMPQQQALV
jgi:hypothetical protein